MTDKQIIINGVDVSRCDFLAKKDDYCSYSGVTYAYKGQCMYSDEEMCKEHPKCFYKKILKQLKAKEQECEQQKAELELFKTSNQTTIDQLKTENETLFKAIEEVNKINKRLESENEKLKEKLQKYKDKEQWEIELNKKRADNFKEMLRMLYGKVEGSSLIEKRSPYEN